MLNLPTQLGLHGPNMNHWKRFKSNLSAWCQDFYGVTHGNKLSELGRHPSLVYFDIVPQENFKHGVWCLNYFFSLEAMICMPTLVLTGLSHDRVPPIFVKCSSSLPS